MALLNWNDRLNLGISIIDSQHKQLVDWLNQLHSAMQEGKGSEHIGKILDQTVDYAKTHFKKEEELFAKFIFPDQQAHKTQHRQFEQQVADFQKKFKAGQAGLTIEVLSFLSDWVTQHIQKSDRHYADYFKSKNITVD